MPMGSLRLFISLSYYFFPALTSHRHIVPRPSLQKRNHIVHRTLVQQIHPSGV